MYRWQFLRFRGNFALGACRRSTHRVGFTLMELLVVVGVVGLLATFLLPAVRSVRGEGTRAVCLSNMRQLAQAVLAYSMDNEDAFPWVNWTPHDVSGDP